MSVATAQTGDDGLAVLARPYDALRNWLPLALILAAAIVVRHFVGANTDVSWEITLSEKILDGQRLYTDLIELNPPASTFLYLPAVALARCEFDRDTVLLHAGRTRALMADAGLHDARSHYFLLLPSAVRLARRVEHSLRRIPLGAQYIVSGIA